MREVTLPEYWKIIRLEEIADMRGGTSFPKAYQGNTEGKYPFYKVSDMNIVGNETLMQASNNWVEEDTVETLRAKLFPRDTVIFPKVGAAVHTNKKRLLSCGSLVDNNVMGVTIRDYNLCIPYYLFYWFESMDLVDFSNPGPLPSITVSTVKNAKIPLPPLSEQRAIAHVLQTIQEARAARQREIELERERKAALMDHLFSYGTKGEPRKQTEIGEIPESWEVVRLGDVADIIYGVQAAVAHLLDESVGVPILTNINITLEGTLDLSTLRYYELPENKRNKLVLEKGDVLFNWRSGSQHHVGKTVLFDLDGEYTFSSFILRFRFVKKVNNEFAVHYFHYLRKKGFFALKRSQSSVNSVFNASISAEIPVVVPSIDEQSGISDVLQACDTKIAALEQEAERLDELFHAMLDELMTGKRSAVSLIDVESVQSASSV